MSSTLERLRRLHSLRPQQAVQPDLPQSELSSDRLLAPPEFSEPVALESLVPGEVIRNAGGDCYVVTARYGLETVRGQRALADLLGRSPAGLAPLYPAASLHDPFDFRRVAFIDTETTGLGGGAGIYAFMVGVGTFESDDRQRTTDDGRQTSIPNIQYPVPNPHFVVRQFFMRHPGEELALLTAVAEVLGEREGVVTFNGRTFDVPLLRNRYRFNRHYLDVEMPAALSNESAPHLDLLHPARRLWKGRLESCALGFLERAILAHTRRGEDVPGSLIPMLYQRYLQGGDATPLGGIFYHNLEDIVSMTFLAERICRHVADPLEADDGELHGADLLALGQIHEGCGRPDSAERALRQAVRRLDSAAPRAEAFDTLGRLLKRQTRWTEAADLWQQWITTLPGPDPRPYEELAKYCEWQAGDLEQAEMWTAWALHNQQTAPAYQRSRQAVDELTHRLARIRAKRAGDDHSTET